MKKNGWALLSTATYLLLLVSFFLRTNVVPRDPKATQGVGDFSVFYVAGMMSRSPAHRELYYLPHEGKQGVSSILWAPVDPSTNWSSLARSAGVKQTDNFLYPPFAAVFFSFLAALPMNGAVVLWRAISFDFILFSIYLILADLEIEPRAPIFLICASASFFFFPVTEMLSIGQVGAFLLFVWTLGIHFQKIKQTKWSAFIFALGTMIKVTPVLAAGLFLVRRQWKWLGWFAVWCGAFSGIGLWRFGWQTNVQFLTKVFPSISCGMPWYLNKSLAGLLTSAYLGRTFLDYGQLPLAISPTVCLVNKIVGVLLFGLILVCFSMRFRKQENWSFELTILALLSLIISPVSWRHHYVLAILPILYLWLAERDRIGRAGLVVLSAATLIIGTPFMDYAVPVLHNRPLQLFLASLTTISCLSLAVVAMHVYLLEGR